MFARFFLQSSVRLFHVYWKCLGWYVLFEVILCTWVSVNSLIAPFLRYYFSPSLWIGCFSRADNWLLFFEPWNDQRGALFTVHSRHEMYVCVFFCIIHLSKSFIICWIESGMKSKMELNMDWTIHGNWDVSSSNCLFLCSLHFNQY